MAIKLFPAYMEAARAIVESVDKEGYGMLIDHATLLAMLGLEEPTTISEYKQFSLDRMFQIEKLKEELLIEHSIYLMSEYGKGYVVLTPDEQVEQAPAKHMKKAKREMIKAEQALVNVDITALSSDGERIRLRGLSKMAFIRSTVKNTKLIE